MIQFNCPNCGKSLSVRDEHAGKNGKCACGTVVHVPGQGTDSVTNNTGAIQSQPAVFPTVATRGTDALPAEGSLSPSEKRLLWGGIGGGLVIAIPILLYFLVFRDKWENDHRQALLDLKSQAASLLAAGKIEDGYHKYEELFDLLGNHTLHDDSLRAEIDEARADKDKASSEAAAIDERNRAAELQRNEEQRAAEKQQIEAEARLHSLESQAKAFVDAGDFQRGIEKYEQALDLIREDQSADIQLAASITRITKAESLARAMLAQKQSAQAATVPAVAASKTVQEAKDELQHRIDRVLGGQKVGDLFVGSLPIWEAFNSMTSMELDSTVQKYDENGSPIPNEFVGRISCKGVNISGEPRSCLFEIDLRFQSGEWEQPWTK